MNSIPSVIRFHQNESYTHSVAISRNFHRFDWLLSDFQVVCKWFHMQFNAIKTLRLSHCECSQCFHYSCTFILFVDCDRLPACLSTPSRHFSCRMRLTNVFLTFLMDDQYYWFYRLKIFQWLVGCHSDEIFYNKFEQWRKSQAILPIKCPVTLLISSFSSAFVQLFCGHLFQVELSALYDMIDDIESSLWTMHLRIGLKWMQTDGR